MNPDIKWFKELQQQDKSPNLLLLLSGGKDSVCCLYKIRRWGKYNKFECVTFTHDWSSQISLSEAHRHCNKLGVKLHEINITQEIERILCGFTNGRPCLKCKPEMYKKAIDFSQKNKFNWIVTGDNANDRTTYNRLITYNQGKEDKRLFCSKYLAGEQGLELPSNISVLRPLLFETSDSIESDLKTNGIIVARNFSTGDKYFEYSREGCALQFCDPGYELTPELRNDLVKYNSIANDYSREYNIRSSVHLPSTFIVSIPEGFEGQIATELKKHGMFVDSRVNSSSLEHSYVSIVVENAKGCKELNTFSFLFKRLCERLELFDGNIIVSENSASFDSPKISIHASVPWDETLVLNIRNTDLNMSLANIYHILLEIFHTRAIKIAEISK